MKSSLLIGFISTLLLASCGVTPEIPAPVANPITPAPIISTGGIETGSGQGKNTQTGSMTSTGVSTQSGDLIFHPERLQKVKDQDGNTAYSGKFLTGIYLKTYDKNNFESDILSTSMGEDGLPMTYYQGFAQSDDFKKQDIIDLLKDFEREDYESINRKLVENPSIYPFSPTCCGFNFPIYLIPYKSLPGIKGIIGILAGGNGGVNYSFVYITVNKNGIIHQLDINTGFESYPNNDTMVLMRNNQMVQSKTGVVDGLVYNQTLISYFTHPGTNKDFDEALEKFKQEIDALYE